MEVSSFVFKVWSRIDPDDSEDSILDQIFMIIGEGETVSFHKSSYWCDIDV